MLVRLRNGSQKSVAVKPAVAIESRSPLVVTADRRQANIGDSTKMTCSRSVAAVESGKEKLVLRMEAVVLPSQGEQCLAVSITRGKNPRAGPTDMAEIEALPARAERAIGQTAESLTIASRLPMREFRP